MGYTKVIRCGSTVETYEYAKDLPIRRKVARPNTHGKRDRAIRPRREDNIRRSAKAFRRIVRSNLGGNERPALLTLTMYQNLQYPASVRIFTDFIARLRREQGNFRYIAVPEFQKRGAVHWHVLVWGIPYDVWETERATRYIARLWLCGFCDCIVTDGSLKLAGYLTKYLSKAMRDLRYNHTKAYYASRNIMRPMSVGSASLVEYIEELVPVDKPPLHVYEFETQWLGRCIYKQYNLDDHATDYDPR